VYHHCRPLPNLMVPQDNHKNHRIIESSNVRRTLLLSAALATALTINRTIKCLSLNTWLVEKRFPKYQSTPHTPTHTRIHLSQLAFMCVAGWLSKMRYIFIKRTTLCFNLSNRTHTNKQWKAPRTHTLTHSTHTVTGSGFGLVTVYRFPFPKGPRTGYYIVLGNSLLL